MDKCSVVSYKGYLPAVWLHFVPVKAGLGLKVQRQSNALLSTSPWSCLACAGGPEYATLC